MEQEGQEPEVGRREVRVVVILSGLVVLALSPLFALALSSLRSVARKWVARQVRWVVLLQVEEGQMRVLAPEAGRGEVQRVQLRGPSPCTLR